jgi:hypothetical protein
MSASRKLLVIGGLALALWGMAYGLYYAVFVEHQTLDSIGGALATGFARAAERRMPEAQAALDAYAQAQFAYVRQVDVHSHWIGLALILFVLGIAFDRVAFSERQRFAWAMALLIGSVIFPLGVLLETVDRGPGPKAVAILGSALIIVSLAAIAWGFARGGESA